MYFGNLQGVKSSKVDGFSQSSGDFATRGSGKNNAVKNLESQGICTQNKYTAF